MTPTPPPLNAELAALLAQTPVLQRPTVITPETIGALRQSLSAMEPDDEELRRDGAFDIEERRVPGPEGAPDIPLLIARPTRPREPQPPVLYFIHGGGMIAGSNRSSTRAVLDIAQEVGLAVVSVEYRLAPEHPYPAAVDDCFAGLEWAAAHAAELGTDSGRVLLCGARAGGGLAAAVALLARDREGPAITTAQMLICPMLDHRNDTPSTHQMASQPFWNRQANDTGWTAYLPGRVPGENVSPYASPALAGDLSGLPPTYLDVGSVDTFRDEVIA